MPPSIVKPGMPACNHAGYLVPTMTRKHRIILQMPEQRPQLVNVDMTLVVKCFNCGTDIKLQPPPELTQEQIDEYARENPL